MEKIIKQKKGITLIALVITIIVLLILAGISISMLAGDNSILQRATDAKKNTGNSQIQERINLAYHSSLVNGQGKITEPSLESELKKEFNRVSLEEGWLDKTSVEGKWIITIDGISLEIPVGKETDNTKTKIKIGTTNLKEVSNLTTLYGETTDYTSIEGIEWQLFYDDSANIYLIASDYVPGDTLPSELITEGQSSTYCRSFAVSDDETTGPITNGERSKDASSANTVQNNPYLNWVGSSQDNKENKYINMKAVAYMLDTSKWSNFAGNATNASAIGGPTLEMFVLSYNAKHNIKLGTYGTSKADITSENANSYGYKVKLENNTLWKNYIETELGSTSDESEKMWVGKEDDYILGMWLASPSSFGEEYVSVTETGYLTGDCASTTYLGFRPLITIPKSSLE